MDGDYRTEIKAWAEKGTELGGIPLSQLPDIHLYMDQVINLLSEKLAFYRRDEESKLLTSSMINNYVKSGLIPHPEKKKYNKEQLAALIMVCLLKQVLSIPDITAILAECGDIPALYNHFEAAQTEAVNKVSAQLRFSLENGDDLKLAALRFAAEANANRAAAERILSEMNRREKTGKSAKPVKSKKE